MRPFGLLWKHRLNAFATFEKLLETFGLLFIPTTGHTDREQLEDPLT